MPDKDKEKKKKQTYIIEIETPEATTRRKIKSDVEPSVAFMPLLAIGVAIDGKIKQVISLATLDREDADALMAKYRVEKEGIVARIIEVEEVEKTEKEVRLE